MKFTKTLKYLIPVVMILLLVLYVDWQDLAKVLVNASLTIFILTILVSMFDHLLMGLKWNLVLKAFRVGISWYKPVLAYLRGRIFSITIPTTIGIDSYKAYYLYKNGAPITPVLSSIITERTIGAFSSLAIVSLLFPFATGAFKLQYSPFLHALCWIIFSSLWLMLNFGLDYSSVLSKKTRFTYFPKAVSTLLNRFLKTASQLHAKKKYLLIFFGISIIEKVNYGICIYLAARTIGINHIPFLGFISITPVLALLERLPISFTSVGLREGLLVCLLHFFDCDPTLSLSVALVSRGSQIIQVIIYGLLFWIPEKRRNDKRFLDDLNDIRVRMT